MMEPTACKDGLLKFFPGVIIVFTILVLSAPYGWTLEQTAQKSFGSAEQAVAALVAAVQDDNDSELLSILGPGSEKLISSGDRVADRNGRTRFLNAYAEHNSREQEDDGRIVLLIGKKDYPFPIPIIRQGETWVFDTRTGVDEIVNRRIGRNELQTIEVMQAYTAAQREYACMIRDAGGPVFAQKLTSSERKKDGLYWKAGEDEQKSPFGPLIARATEKGYAEGLEESPAEPFQGYYFRILKAQGKHATGGAFNYMVDDKMILGFALIAYPAKYGSSGIMTFIVNQEGVIYEKDLGTDTGMIASAVTTFDPDDSWEKYEEQTVK